MHTLAHLDDAQLTKLQEFEEHEGIKVLALARVDAKVAQLDAQELAHLRAMEDELGMCLVAVK